MTRNPFGWDLPPGCTQRHIDEAAGGDEEVCEKCNVYLEEVDGELFCPTCDAVQCDCCGKFRLGVERVWVAYVGDTSACRQCRGLS